MSRYQFVLWPILRRDSWFPLVCFYRTNGSMSKIYVWCLQIGPVEIRRWNTKERRNSNG